MTSRTNVTAKQSPEAMASMAGIGRSIDQAIGRLSPPALGLPTIQIVSRSDDTDGGRGSGSAPQTDKSLIDLPAAPAVSAPPAPPAESAPPQRSAPPLPKLKPLRREAEAIDEAIQQATKARELAGVDGDVREGVRAIEEVGRSFDRMKNPLTDGVREGEKPTLWSRIEDAKWYGGAAGTAAGWFGGPVLGSVVGGGTTGLALGGYVLYDASHPEPFTMAETSEKNLKGLQELAELALASDKDLTSQDRAFLFQQFQAAWMAWNAFLQDLIRNIESPDSSPEAAALRSDSLEILPKIISDTEEGLELYRQLLPEDVQKLNREYLNRAIRLRNGVDYSGSPLPHTPGVLPASFAYKSSVARDSVLQPASYTMPMSLGAPPAESDLPTRPETATRATIEELMERVLLRLSEPLRLDPVRLEVRLLDDRVIARRLDGNRSVEVDLSRGYRMVGYLSV